MILSKQKPLEEILEAVSDETSLFIVGCAGCALGSASGGPEEVAAMKEALADAGKTVTDTIVIDFLCNKALAGDRLGRRIEALKSSDAILVMCCGVGVQAVAKMVDIPVRAGCDTVGVTGVQGSWPSEERCMQCGECVLSYTAGICPVATCAKGLLNGVCGGSQDGMCEVDPENRRCGWEMIFDRAKELGQLDRLKTFLDARDYRKREIDKELRTTIRWALEVEEG